MEIILTVKLNLMVATVNLYITMMKLDKLSILLGVILNFTTPSTL